MITVKRHLLLLLVPALLAVGCAPHSDEPNSKNDAPESHNSQEYLAASVLFVQRSAEYRALCYQAFQLAAMHLAEVTAQSPDARLAVVLDLDETVLDNSPYSAWQVHSGNAFSAETWKKWTDKAMAKEVPGSGRFLRMADSLGVALFYISNRDTSALEPTISNMRNLNMPQLEVDHFLLKTSSSDKTSRREAVKERGYQIALYIGDNLGDFHDQWDKKSIEERATLADAAQNDFGSRYIVLPNPVYGTWEGALYSYDRSLTDAARDSIRKAVFRDEAAWAE